MRTLSLFSGVGGLDLGLERAGFQVVALCEQDAFCQAVLAERFPGVPVFTDVREVGTPTCPLPHGIECIAGGFPCQDISAAGRGDGITGERSGLWFEMLRIIGTVRPRWVVAENVPTLRTRGADTVLGGLEAEGYTARPLVVGANHTGAPHRRQRVFIVGSLANSSGAGLARRRHGQVGAGSEQPLPAGERGARGEGLADSHGSRRELERRSGLLDSERAAYGHDAHRRDRWPSRPGEPQHEWEARRTTQAEPGLGRATDGLPAWVDSRERRARLRALGNAVVPQVAEAIGRAVMAVAREHAQG